MILSVIFSFLLILVLSSALYFLFMIFLPSLERQNVNTSSMMFSELETDFIGPDETPFPQKIAVLKNSDEAPFDRKGYKGPWDCSLFFKYYAPKTGIYNICAGFGSCLSSCPENAISIKNGRAQISTFCTGCGRCIDACPATFIQIHDFSDSRVNKKYFSENGKPALYKIFEKVYNRFSRKKK